jgi:DNA repair exonuclease SbcCD nuclease subunit
MRFIHTADWQLGMTRHFLEGEAQPRYSAARREAVSRLGELAAQTGAEFVVVAGDVFENNHLDPRVVSQSLEAMRVVGVPVYLLPGNHDPLEAGSLYTGELFGAERPDNVVVLDRAGLFDVRPGLQIVAAPWRSKRPTADLVAEVLADIPSDGVKRIVVAHGGVDTLDPDPSRPSVIGLAAVAAALDRGAVHYVALGDKHSRTRVGDGGRIWYSGSPEVTNYDHIESDPGHVLVVDLDEGDGRVRVAAHRVGSWRFTTLRRAVNDSRDLADLDMNLDLIPDKDRTVVQLALQGALTVTDRAALDTCLDRYSRLFAWIGLWDSHCDLAVVPSDGEFADLGIGGFAAAAVDELVSVARAAGGESQDARDAQAALALLIRLAGPKSGAA